MSSTLITVFFFFAIFTQIGNCVLNEYRFNREIDTLARAATNIIKQYYSKRASALSLIHLAMQPLTNFKQSEIINRVILATKSNLAYVVEEPKYMKQSEFLRSNGIIFLDGYEAFR